MSSEDRLFAAPVQMSKSSCPTLLRSPASCPALLSAPPLLPAPPIFSVVGGRMVQQPAAFPLNGQQLQLQLDQLTSAMTDMIMDDDTMEVKTVLLIKNYQYLYSFLKKAFFCCA
jgi:hypothetical protein